MKKDYLLKPFQILSIKCYNLDFLKCIPYKYFDLFVSRAEMSLYTFQFYLDINEKKLTYVANDQLYYIKSEPYYFDDYDFQLLITKLCYYKYTFLLK